MSQLEVVPIAEKRCSKCKRRKPLTEFYADFRSTGGRRRSCCKPCCADDQRKYLEGKRGRELHRTAMRTAQRKRYKTSESHLRRVGAYNTVRSAIKRGGLPPVTEKKCADCDEQAQHYHHKSYDEADWSKVVPLCCVCHHIRHQES